MEKLLMSLNQINKYTKILKTSWHRPVGGTTAGWTFSAIQNNVMNDTTTKKLPGALGTKIGGSTKTS